MGNASFWKFFLSSNLLIGLMGAAAFAQFSNGVYSFDELQPGELAGQDGWTATRMYSKDGELRVVEIDEADKAVTGTPGKTRYYFRLFAPQDDLPGQATDGGCVAVQFEIEAGPFSGTFFVGSLDAGIAVVWDEKLLVRANGISGKATLLAEIEPPQVEDGTWVTLRCELKGDRGRVLWKHKGAPDSEFATLQGGESFEVGALWDTVSSWDRMGVAIGKAGTMRMNNLVPRAMCTELAWNTK